ncbi:MAG TPA: sulfotransferase family protein [Actinomycetota bacterium]
MTNRVKVLYIAGWGGSGTTLIDNVMGQLDGCWSTGELHALWEGLRDGRHRCGCGMWIGHCPFWTEVLRTAFPGGVDPAAVVRWQNETARMRRFPAVVRAVRGGRAPRAVRAYSDISARLYRGIAEVAGADVVVDSSKVPSYAALLGSMPEVEAYVVQLVRDPRAVAYSWGRRDAPKSLVDSTIHWVAWNAATDVVRRLSGGSRSMLIRYEDFALAPQDVTARLARMVDRDPAQLPFSDPRTVILSRNHTVSGNRSRFRVGPVAVSLDDEWTRSFTGPPRLATTMLALPMLYRVGYRVRVEKVPGVRAEAAST